jgi:hypothetical protein
VLYVAKFDDAVYVLHCFHKKTQKTSKADLNLAAQRYRDLLKELAFRTSTLFGNVPRPREQPVALEAAGYQPTGSPQEQQFLTRAPCRELRRDIATLLFRGDVDFERSAPLALLARQPGEAT